MAIGTPVERRFNELSAQLGTSVVSPASNLAAGTFQVLAVHANANKVLSSVTDSVGNTWVVDKTVTDGARTINFASCQVATQISTSDTVTMTWSVATSGIVVYWIQEVSGIATSSAFDTFASGTGTGTALVTGSTPTLAQADEIVFALTRTTASAPAWTKGASYSDPTTPSSSVTTGISLEYKIVAATTAVTADGTWSTSGTWIILCVTYKAAAAVVAPRNVAGWITRSGGY